MKKNKKKDSIVFSEQIDNTINSFAVSLTFISIGIFLYFNQTYFGNEMVSSIFQWTFITLGILMVFTSFSTINKKEKSNIKGFDSLAIGIILLIIWFFLFRINSLTLNIISIFILIFGIYGNYRGLLEIFYSIIDSTKNKNKKIKIIDILIFIAKIATFALTILNILQAIGILNTTQ